MQCADYSHSYLYIHLSQLCIGLQVYQTEAGYILELELRNFSNPHRRLHNGDCCDGTTLELSLTCSRPCTVAFVFCWKNYGSTSTSVEESNCISRGSTSVYGSQDTITFTNGVLPSTSEKPPNNPLIMMGDVWPVSCLMGRSHARYSSLLLHFHITTMVHLCSYICNTVSIYI